MLLVGYHECVLSHAHVAPRAKPATTSMVLPPPPGLTPEVHPLLPSVRPAFLIFVTTTIVEASMRWITSCSLDFENRGPCSIQQRELSSVMNHYSLLKTAFPILVLCGWGMRHVE